MTADHYRRNIIVSNTAAAAFRALTKQFDKWWSVSSGSINQVNDIVTFRFDPTYWTMRVTNLVPDKKVELECLEAHHVPEGQPDSIRREWEGTKLKWKIEQLGDRTRILFTHEGLVPALGCYDICESGWDYFFVGSLKNFLETGQGNPG